MGELLDSIVGTTEAGPSLFEIRLCPKRERESMNYEEESEAVSLITHSSEVNELFFKLELHGRSSCKGFSEQGC